MRSVGGGVIISVLQTWIPQEDKPVKYLTHGITIPTVTFPAAGHHCPVTRTKLHCSVTEIMCVNNLPTVVTWKQNGQVLNPRPHSRKCNTPTTPPLGQTSCSGYCWSCYECSVDKVKNKKLSECGETFNRCVFCNNRCHNYDILMSELAELGCGDLKLNFMAIKTLKLCVQLCM